MAITRTPIVDDDGTGTTGTVIDNAWKTELYNQIDGVVASAWIPVAFNAANFWPGVTAAHLSVNQYTVSNKTLIWLVQIANAPVPAPAANLLRCTIPGGYSIAAGIASPCAFAFDGTGGNTVAFCTLAAAQVLGVQRLDSANWGGPTCYAYFTAIIPIG